jgi:predicted phage tail component-like protein
MTMWFEFGGIRSGDLNIKVLRFRKPVLPEFSDHYEFIPGRDGSILFPQNFTNRVIEIDCLIMYSSKENRSAEERELAKLFTKEEKRLIISDEPDVYYLAKLSETFELDRHKTMSSFTLVFNCQPFALTEEKKVTFSNIDADQEVTFENIGTFESYPEIEIILAESINELSVRLNDETLTFTPNEEVASGSVISINSDDYSFRVDDQPIILELSGDFPVVCAGENTLIVSAATQHIVVCWQPRFV